MGQRNPIFVGRKFRNFVVELEKSCTASLSQITLLHQDLLLHLYSIDENLAPIHVLDI